MQHEEEHYDLIMACKQGDRQALESLIDFYAQPVHRLIYSVLRNGSVVDDLAQETFMRMITNIQNYEFRAPFRAWLFRIAVNLCRDHIRKKKVRKIVTYFEVDPETGEQQTFHDQKQNPLSDVQSNETMDAIQKAISKLPQPLQTVFILREVNDLTYEEIARSLKIRVGTVKSRLFRARKQLADVLYPQLKELS